MVKFASLQSPHDSFSSTAPVGLYPPTCGRRQHAALRLVMHSIREEALAVAQRMEHQPSTVPLGAEAVVWGRSQSHRSAGREGAAAPPRQMQDQHGQRGHQLQRVQIQLKIPIKYIGLPVVG